jgi:hypothetical protein
MCGIGMLMDVPRSTRRVATSTPRCVFIVVAVGVRLRVLARRTSQQSTNTPKTKELHEV